MTEGPGESGAKLGGAGWRTDRARGQTVDVLVGEPSSIVENLVARIDSATVPAGALSLRAPSDNATVEAAGYSFERTASVPGRTTLATAPATKRPSRRGPRGTRNGRRAGVLADARRASALDGEAGASRSGAAGSPRARRAQCECGAAAGQDETAWARRMYFREDNFSEVNSGCGYREPAPGGIAGARIRCREHDGVFCASPRPGGGRSARVRSGRARRLHRGAAISAAV